MRINHNISAMAGQNAARISQQDLASSLEKLSTGLRINSASDDAAGLSVSEQLRSQVRGLSQAKRNAQDGIALLSIAEGAAGEISGILQRMRELAVQSANGTLTTVQRSYTDAEYTQLGNEIQRIAESTQYNGMSLLDGAAGSFGTSSGASVLHVGSNSSTSNQMSISMSSITLGALGLSSGGAVTGITTQTAATTAITTLDTAINSVNNLRSSLGAYINRLDTSINTLASQEVNMQQAESMIRDVDFASETTNFTRAQILSQASMTMIAQANSAPSSVLALFQ